MWQSMFNQEMVVLRERKRYLYRPRLWHWVVRPLDPFGNCSPFHSDGDVGMASSTPVLQTSPSNHGSVCIHIYPPLLISQLLTDAKRFFRFVELYLI